MAIKRTKEQKQHAQEKRESEVVKIAKAMGGTPAQATQFSYTAQKNTNKSAKMIVGVTPDASNHIKSDLIKTLVVSVLLFGLLVGIYLYLRYN